VKPPARRKVIPVKRGAARQPRYPDGKPVATRHAVGNTLVRLAKRYPSMIVLDADVGNSTGTELFDTKFPKRFIQSYIAEQNMVGMAQGLSHAGKLPVAVTFAAFWSRSFDQLRMAQYGDASQVFVGSHAGVSIGEDGPSQMGLEDIAEFRSLANSTIYYPADAFAAERLTELALTGTGMTYIRTSRPASPLLYGPRTTFVRGGSHTIRSSRNDQATIVAAGVPLFEALQAAEQLDAEGVAVRVIDLYSVKPLDRATLRKAVRQTKHLVVVEDHNETGGIAEAVQSALGPDAGAVTSLAVTQTPRSGTPAELLRHQGIDASAIVKVVKKLTTRSSQLTAHNS
jgi:transketolase